MSNLANIHVSLFANKFSPIPIRTVPLAKALENIRTGTYKSQVEHVRHILATRGKTAYDTAKGYLQAFTFAGTFLPSRKIEYLHQHSGVVHGDLDHLHDVAAVKDAICRDGHTVYAFVSPSGDGLKCGIYVPIIFDDLAYKHAWGTISAVYETLYGGHWDPSGKDVSRLCYASYDPEIYINLDATCFEVPPPQPLDPKLPTPRPSIPRREQDPHDYAERAIRTAVDMIQSAPMGTRHHTRLKAARLLGGYVAGGLLTEERAYGVLAQALVGHTEDLERALKTVEDGISYGQANPITLDDLEAERQAWLDAHHRISNAKTHNQPHTDADPWAGTGTLPIRPYTGYKSRIRKGVPRGF